MGVGLLVVKQHRLHLLRLAVTTAISIAIATNGGYHRHKKSDGEKLGKLRNF